MNTINPSYVPASFIDTSTGKLAVGVTQETAEAVQAGVLTALSILPDAGDKAFLQGLANLTPDQLDTPAERTEVLASLTAAAQLLATAQEHPEFLPYTGDITKFLARAMVEFAGQQRQQALDDRLMARQAAQADLLSQASQQEKAAKEMMTGAIVNAVMGVVGGAFSFIGAAGSFGGQVKSIGQMSAASKQSAAAQKTMDNLLDSTSSASSSAKTTNAAADAAKMPALPATPTPTKTGPVIGAHRAPGAAPDVPVPGTPKAKDMTPAEIDDAVKKMNATDAADFRKAQADKAVADREFAMAEKLSMAHQTAGQVSESIGGILKTIGSSTDASMQGAAKLSEAQGTREAAQAEYMKQVADQQKEVQDSMQEMMNQIINFIKEMQDAEVEAMRAITKG